MESLDPQSELAQTLKGRKPPYPCPVCQKEYRSVTGILYHMGKTGPPCKGPRCLAGEDTPQGSPKPPGSPVNSSIRRKGPRRDLTWAEAQRLVELEFEHCYKRVEIDHNLDVSLHSDDEEGDESVDLGNNDRRGSTGTGPRTPQRRGKSAAKGSKGESQQNRGKWSSKSKNKGKRKSKLKTPGKEGEESSALPKAEVNIVDSLEFADAPARESSYYRFVEQSAEDLDETIEYDMDEEDYQWLSLVNEDRKSLGYTSVPQEVFEILMDRLEKECFFESHTTGPGIESNNMYNIDENAVCCICNDGECHNTNAILFCDMCNLAVHQECYGVPYIPEGQWLCRRCLQSPSRGVDCVLCPNKGGAFKQTLDSKWAHVICAIWIPEVQFANPVFLEPIDGINDIPPARWKLTCYICHKRMGACIQCTKANCYVAFHVTCAQLAGLHMKVELIKGGEVRKTAYCDSHTPPSVKRKKERLAREKAAAAAAAEGKQDCGGEGNEEKETASDNEREEQADDAVKGEAGEGSEAGSRETPSRQDREGSDDVIRKVHCSLGVKKPSANQPVVNIPYVPQHRLERIISRVSLHKKSQFIPKLVSYWKLKRQSRNGVPLLRRLQASTKGQRPTANLTEEEREVLAEQLTHWKNLRHDLERARMLIELIRKREKLKREHLKMVQSIKELQMKPLNTLIRRMIERLRRKDPADIFAEPVSVDEVPDYLDVIKNPMDFTTMKRKLEANEYHTLHDFKKDFYLVWHNATIYNHKDTIYYRAALRIKEAGHKMIDDVERLMEGALVDLATGMHNPEVQEPPPLTPSTLEEVLLKEPILFDENGDNDDKVFSSSSGSRNRRLSSTASLSLDEQVEILQEKLEMVPVQYSGFAKKRREKNLKRELQALRRQMKQERKISESDEHGTPPPRRQRAASIPRNAEELACHVLHGSLRLTPSRQQILSHSGIRLEERAASQQQEGGQQQQTNTQGLPHPLQTSHHTHHPGESGLLHSHTAASGAESATSQPNIKSPHGIRISVEGAESNTDSDDENSSESSSSSSEDEEEEEEERGGADKDLAETNSRSTTSPQKRARGRHKEDLAASRERSRSNRRPRQQFKSRRRPSGGGGGAGGSRPQASRSKRKLKVPPRLRLDSGGAYSSTSEAEFPINGTTNTNTLGVGNSRELGRISREMSKCSSVYETANEGYMSIEEKLMTSPLSDTITGGIPKATGIEDLTARNLSVQKSNQGQARGKKRKRSSAGPSSEKGKKKSRLESGSSADGGPISKSKTINGLVNGSGANNVEIKPLDLVWAKCRGYPPYPALVIDPNIPPKGLNINGERIQAPSDEVMELRDKNATAIYLVRFFDGRRTWQWLPPDKIEPLGVDPDYDMLKVSQSGNSKRSVKEAYQRAKKYLARRSKSSSKPSVVSDNDDSDSGDKDSSSDSSNSDS